MGLSWTAPATAGGAPPASYHVYEGTSSGFTLGTPVTSTSDTHTTVTGLTNGTTYYFVVTAVDGSGTVSGASGEASAQPLATAVLASATTSVPKPVIVSLAAVAAVAIAAAGALTARRLRKRLRKRPPAAPPADVRAVPEMGPPSPVSLHEITSHVSAAEGDSHEVFLPETYVVRLEPLPAAIITTLEEIGRMTTPGPDGVITAADLLFGSTEGAHEALTRHVMSAGRTTARAFERLPRVTREAAVREAAVVAVGLLKIDLMEVLVSGWREHRDIFTAARRTLDMPGSKELVGLAPHRITTVQQPSVGILVDNHRVHTLQLGLSIFFEVTGLVAGIHAGRLAAIHAGRGDLGVALTIHELEVLTNRTHLELPGVKSLQRGFRLLPANAYPDESHGHPGGQHPGGQASGAALPTAVTAAAHFPGVDLMDGHVPPANLNAAGPASWSDAAEHPSSAESDHSSASWWEKSPTHTRSGPTRTP